MFIKRLKLNQIKFSTIIEFAVYISDYFIAKLS